MIALNEMIHNVITEVVRHNLCIGCGLCAGICPREALQMQFNSLGEYTPEPTANSCSSTCSICLKTCPFYAENRDAMRVFFTESLLDKTVAVILDDIRYGDKQPGLKALQYVQKQLSRNLSYRDARSFYTKLQTRFSRRNL